MKPLIFQASDDKGTTKSFSFHDKFSGGGGLFPINAKLPVNQCLLGIRQARFAHLYDPTVHKRQARGHQTVGSQQAPDCFPIPHVPALRELMAHPAKEVLYNLDA